MSSKKLPLKLVKQLPWQSLNRMIDKAREYLEQDETWRKVCQERELDPALVHLIPIHFGDLPVSARTMHGVITLNYKLLCDGDFFKDFSYLVHEGVHWLDQCFGDQPTQGADDGDYLHNEFEQDAFSQQVEYLARHFGEEEADHYVENLLDHHDKEGKEKQELKEILTENI